MYLAKCTQLVHLILVFLVYHRSPGVRTTGKIILKKISQKNINKIETKKFKNKINKTPKKQNSCSKSLGGPNGQKIRSYIYFSRLQKVFWLLVEGGDHHKIKNDGRISMLIPESLTVQQKHIFSIIINVSCNLLLSFCSFWSWPKQFYIQLSESFLLHLSFFVKVKVPIVSVSKVQPPFRQRLAKHL